MHSTGKTNRIFLLIMFAAIFVVVESLTCKGNRLSSSQRLAILRQHNKFRSDLIHGKLLNKDDIRMPTGKNMYRLRWSCSLEYTAQKWADQCQFAHSTGRNKIGENVYTYWSSRSVANLKNTAGTDAGKSWWDELPKLYPNNPSNNLTYKISGRGVLHFTQMAWGKTYGLGCGVAMHCDNGHRLMVICHYKPNGNMITEQIYELGRPCRTGNDCRSRKCEKSSGLCWK